MAMTKPREELPEELARRAAAAGSMDALKASGAFDELMAQIDSGQLELDGKDGFIQQLRDLPRPGRPGKRGPGA